MIRGARLSINDQQLAMVELFYSSQVENAGQRLCPADR
jgi:hypothetical protein